MKELSDVFIYIKVSIVIFYVMTSAEVISMEFSQTIKIKFKFMNMCTNTMHKPLLKIIPKSFVHQNVENLEDHLGLGNETIHRTQRLMPLAGQCSKTFCSLSLGLWKTTQTPIRIKMIRISKKS